MGHFVIESGRVRSDYAETLDEVGGGVNFDNNHALGTSSISECQCSLSSCFRRKNGVAWLKSLGRLFGWLAKKKGGLEARPLRIRCLARLASLIA